MRGHGVAVIGGGVIGCAIARDLASRGVRVTVLERDEPGAHASWAAAGMLSPLAEADRADAFLRLLLAGRARFPDLAADLLSETGIDIDYRAEGTLLLALSQADEAVLEGRWRWQSAAGLPVERLGAAEARALEPSLSAAVRSALRFPDDHQVDNRKLARALHASALRAGASFATGVEAASLDIQGGRARGVVMRDGVRLDADTVVVAAGCWSGRLAGLPRPLPVEPVHGQLLSLDGSGARLDHVVDTPRVYLVPRRDGRIIVGATAERTGFASTVTDRATRTLWSAAAEAVPGLAGVTLLDVWSGLRPGTPDGSPIIGPDPEVENLFYAAGHYRNGILLAPITAEAIGGLVAGASHPAETAPFGIARFSAHSPR